MSNLIDRSAVINSIEDWMEDDAEDEFDHGYDFAMRRAMRIIRYIPTVDAVSVVRCRDCKHRGGYHCPMFYEELWSYDEDSSKWIEYDKTVDNGYCERGEKIGR